MLYKLNTFFILYFAINCTKVNGKSAIFPSSYLVILLRFHVLLDFCLLISWMCTLGLALDYTMRQ